VVATLSLGSHAVFHYYRYKSTEEAVRSDEDISGKEHAGKGRVIDKMPVISVLLEPRSLVITSRELYASHLHGIDDVAVDVFPAPSIGLEFPTRLRLANLELISDTIMKEAVANGGSVDRHVRYSLTCRDIARVVNRGVGFGASMIRNR
jgi:alkylated DNA repair protein alkB homolog 6